MEAIRRSSEVRIVMLAERRNSGAADKQQQQPASGRADNLLRPLGEESTNGFPRLALPRCLAVCSP